MFDSGVENVAYLVDQDLVLKMARADSPKYWLAREATILETLQFAGLPIPKYIGYESGEPAILFETLVPGIPLESCTSLPSAERLDVAREVGLVLANLHRLDLPMVSPYRDSEASSQPCVGRDLGLVRRWRGGMDKLRAEHLVDDLQCDWLERQFEALLLNAPDQQLAVLHKDVRPGHIFVCQGPSATLGGIIDFGDAAVGPAEIEFYYAWLRWWTNRNDIWAMADAYIEATGASHGFTERVEFLRIASCVSRVPHPDPDASESALNELRALLSGSPL